MVASTCQQITPIQSPQYQRHRPEDTLLYKVIRENVATVFQKIEADGKTLPKFVKKEFDAFLDCGILAKGFLRIRCDSCKKELLVTFSCKKRGFCPSCGGRRMSDTAAHLVDHVFPERPVRQWVLSFPYNLRYLFAYNGKALSQALQIMIRVIRRYYLKKSTVIGRISKECKVRGKKVETGSIMLVQRFGGSVNLNPHFHVLFMDGVFGEDGSWFGVSAPTNEEVAEIVNKIKTRVFKALEKKGYITGFDINFDSDDLFNSHGELTELMLGSIQGLNCFDDNKGRKIQRIGKLGSGQWAELRGNRCAYRDGFCMTPHPAPSPCGREAYKLAPASFAYMPMFLLLPRIERDWSIYVDILLGHLYPMRG